MGDAIGSIVPTAAGVALSPIPIVAVILMLFSAKTRSNGPAFLVGWFGGIVFSTGLVLLLVKPDRLSDDGGEPSTLQTLLFLGLGALLLALALKQWRSRPGPGEESEMPKWMASIDKLAPRTALGMGALLSGINPKNLLLNIAAGAEIARHDLSSSDQIVTLVIYTIIASISVAVPVIWYLIAQEKASRTLEGWRKWLTVNNAAVMAVLFLILGARLFGQGLGGLID